MTTSAYLVKLLRKKCHKRGDQTKFARTHALILEKVNATIHGKYKMTRTIAWALGYEQTWVKRKPNTN